MPKFSLHESTDVTVDAIANKTAEIAVGEAMDFWQNLNPSGYARVAKGIADRPGVAETALVAIFTGLDLGMHALVSILPQPFKIAPGIERFGDDVLGRSPGVIVRYVRDHPPQAGFSGDVSEDDLKRDIADFGATLRDKVSHYAQHPLEALDKVVQRIKADQPPCPQAEEIEADNARRMGDIASSDPEFARILEALREGRSGLGEAFDIIRQS